jgi:outer membrane murein-binding lipoprotein Lpp
MERLIRKSSMVVGLAGAILAVSLLAGCSSNEPTPEQRATNAANQADQAAARADAAAQKSAASAAQAQAAASRVAQAASDAKAAADRAEAIASRTMSEHHPMHHHRRHRGSGS